MNLRTRFERFCYRNRDKGIPNLMLYITIGSAIVYLLTMFNGGTVLFELLCFDKGKILQGQVWRLFTYVFTEMSSGSIFTLIFLYFFYILGRHIEQSMGTFRFNLLYLSGVLLMDIFAMIFCPVVPVGNISYTEATYLLQTLPIYYNMAYYLHLSLLLTFATTHPDSQFLIFFIIPIKAWVMGIIYLVLISAEIFNMSYPEMLFPHNLFPLVGLLNYLLFAGKDVLNLFPFLKNRRRHQKPKKTKTGTIPFRQGEASTQKQSAPYTHRCTVCGRTDVTNPELEFRYCSRCNGYFCYCEDHISNHTHIE